jgi:hypothetical protein
MPILGIIASSKFGDAGDFESIATVSVGSGGAANVEFTSIPATFTHLQIRGIARSARSGFSDDNMALQLNSDTGNNYAWHQLSGNGTAASAAADSTIANIRCGRMTAATAGASTFGVNVIDILDYANTNKYKTIRTLTGYDNNGDGLITLFSGLWQNTNAITSIKLFSQTGANNFVQYSQFALYGIRT